MVFITVENYLNAQVHTITVKNKDFFWVKMKNVQNGLGLKMYTWFSKKKILWDL